MSVEEYVYLWAFLFDGDIEDTAWIQTQDPSLAIDVFRDRGNMMGQNPQLDIIKTAQVIHSKEVS